MAFCLFNLFNTLIWKMIQKYSYATGLNLHLLSHPTKIVMHRTFLPHMCFKSFFPTLSLFYPSTNLNYQTYLSFLALQIPSKSLHLLRISQAICIYDSQTEFCYSQKAT